MSARYLVAAIVAMSCVSPIAGQTQTELLERAIFTEETLGDLDGAIRIYEELLRAPSVPRQIATQVERRLENSLRRRQHAAITAAQTARPAADAQAVLNGCCGLFSGNYDVGRPAAMNGVISRVEWINPLAVLYLDGADGAEWAFTISAPNTMIRLGMTRTSLRPGDAVFVRGYRATGAAQACPAPLPNACGTLTGGAVHASATLIIAADGSVVFDRNDERLEAAGGRPAAGRVP